jgi:HAD superfamily hydrolase (TIGR01549 family)
MATAKKPRLILFDLDDTLAPAESIYDLALSNIGIAPKDPLYLSARQKVKEKLPPLAPVARSRFLYLKAYLELNHSYTAQKNLELADAYERNVAEKMAEQWKILKRPQLFHKLKNAGFHLAVLTNETCRMQTRKLAAMEDQDHFFELLLTSEERGFEKPEQKLFSEVLSHFKISASEALMVGDSFENDIRPCIEMKIPCIQTLEFKDSTQRHSQTIDKLDQILDFL